MKKVKRFFQHHFNHPNYLYFFISLMVMLVVPSFSSFVVFGDLFLKITYGLVILIACIYTSRSYQDVIAMGVLGGMAYLLFILNENFHVPIMSFWTPIFTLLFFGLVFLRLMQYVFRPKTVSLNDVLALCSGYLILGVTAAPFFLVLDMQLDNAFSLEKNADFYDLLYFSYITLTAVGYGDIVPVHKVAKSMALILGIIGQLYLAILVGIIVGKYLTSGKRTWFYTKQKACQFFDRLSYFGVQMLLLCQFDIYCIQPFFSFLNIIGDFVAFIYRSTI